MLSRSLSTREIASSVRRNFNDNICRSLDYPRGGESYRRSILSTVWVAPG